MSIKNVSRNTPNFPPAWIVLAVAVFAFSLPTEVMAQDAKLLKVLKIRPRQTGVDYDVPTSEEVKSCKLQAPPKSIGKLGYTVVDPDGRVIRQFLDSSGNKALDQWSYFKDGIEVYRDLDTNGDGKADQHRWMGTAGIRWGMDNDQNGTIDAWRMISAEEVASEVFESIKSGDMDRFQRVLLSPRELSNLELGARLGDSVKKSLASAKDSFREFSKRQRIISPKSKWVHFGTSQPSLVPAGNDGSKKDVVIYDHASAVFQNGREFEQVAIGTIVQVGPNSWRACELPQMVVDGKAVANGGILFPGPNVSGVATAPAKTDPKEAKFAELYSQLDKVEKAALEARKQSEIESLEAKRASLRTQLIENSRQQDRVNWIESLADVVTDAYQRDRYPQGLMFLKGYQRKLSSSGEKNGVHYISWRMLNSRFSKSIAEGDSRERAKATNEYISEMEDFAKNFPDSRFAPECLNNLAMHYEISDRENPEKAIAYYTRCAKSFPSTDYGKKARGAAVRLGAVGKPVRFVGKTIDGRTFDLQKQSKIVVIHFWESTNSYAVDEFETFQRIAEKYKDELIVVGANVDESSNSFKAFMQKNRKFKWTQLHSPGGVLKSPLAHQLGPASIPMILLFDESGRLVEENIPADYLDREISALLRKKKK